MDRELAKAVLEVVVFLIVSAICFLGVPVMISILLCQSLGIPFSDPRTIAVTAVVTIAWFFAYALYSKVEIESVIERCKACCMLELHEVCLLYTSPSPRD